MSWNKIQILIAQHCKCTKRHWSVHLKQLFCLWTSPQYITVKWKQSPCGDGEGWSPRPRLWCCWGLVWWGRCCWVSAGPLDSHSHVRTHEHGSDGALFTNLGAASPTGLHCFLLGSLTGLLCAGWPVGATLAEAVWQTSAFVYTYFPSPLNPVFLMKIFLKAYFWFYISFEKKNFHYCFQ